MNGSGHASITREAVLSVRHPALEGALLDKIVDANLHEDDDQERSANHFDNCAFREGLEKIYQDKSHIARESDRLSRRSVEALGRILHTVQDFYAHSNWIELHVAEDPLPIWDLVSESTLPPGVFSGLWTVGRPKCPRATRCLSHGELNKDSETSGMGPAVVESGPHAGKTHWELARRAALEATAIQVRWLLDGTTDYRVTVKTGDLDRADTDADVFLVLHGPNGSKTGRMQLDNVDRNDFERGKKDEFLLAVHEAPAEVSAITIGYEPGGDSGPHAGWFLEWVKIEEVASGRSWLFPCNRWLDEDGGERKTILRLTGSLA